ncbi:hypothetical protein Esti_000387 [Eimeria stiedai]
MLSNTSADSVANPLIEQHHHTRTSSDACVEEASYTHFAARLHRPFHCTSVYSTAMAPLRLPFLAAGYAALAAVAIASNDVTEVQWPENGAIKVGMPKSPANLTVDLQGCLTVNIDWPGDSVTVHESGNSTHLPGSERMRQDGGQLVLLLNRESGQVHVVAFVEAVDGSFDSRMLTLDMQQCPLSRLRLSSPTPAQLKDVTVGVSVEIEHLYREAKGFNAVDEATE